VLTPPVIKQAQELLDDGLEAPEVADQLGRHTYLLYGYKVDHFKTIAYLMTGKLDFSKVNNYC